MSTNNQTITAFILNRPDRGILHPGISRRCPKTSRQSMIFPYLPLTFVSEMKAITSISDKQLFLNIKNRDEFSKPASGPRG